VFQRERGYLMLGVAVWPRGRPGWPARFRLARWRAWLCLVHGPRPSGRPLPGPYL